MKLHFFSLTAVLVTAGAAAHAQTFTPLITQIVGTGSKESFFTLDFQDGTTDHNYAFGYEYDGTKTGADFLTALSSGTPLVIGSATSSYGVYVTSFAFNGHSQVGSGNGYWAYFVGTNGQDWTYSMLGASDRTLSNGSWDGWSWDPDYRTGSNAAPRPLTPAAVPEASSAVSLGVLALLGAGVIAVRRKKRAW
jgi:hypothetical protein